MQQITIEPSTLAYPVLLFREGYIYVAVDFTELCTHSRSTFNDTIQRTLAGELHLLCADGHLFDIIDWACINPYGGIRGFAARVLRSIFAAPVAGNKTLLPLPEFKEKLIQAVVNRYPDDSESAFVGEFLANLRKAESYQAAMTTLSSFR